MSYNVIAIPKFEKELKRLAKKYPSLKFEYIDFVKSLTHLPIQGTQLGNNCYKIRIAISSKGKGKSGGARIITHVKVSNETVFLLSIYDKSETETILDREILELIKSI